MLNLSVKVTLPAVLDASRREKEERGEGKLGGREKKKRKGGKPTMRTVKGSR